jgi:hypothetical protein
MRAASLALVTFKPVLQSRVLISVFAPIIDACNVRVNATT